MAWSWSHRPPCSELARLEGSVAARLDGLESGIRAVSHAIDELGVTIQGQMARGVTERQELEDRVAALGRDVVRLQAGLEVLKWVIGGVGAMAALALTMWQVLAK